MRTVDFCFLLLQAEENILARVSGGFGLVDERGSSNSNGGKSRKKKENQTVPGFFPLKHFLLELSSTSIASTNGLPTHYCR